MYQKLITMLLQEMGRSEIPARIIEGWMRCENPTLDHLTRAEFAKEVQTSVLCFDGTTPEENEEIAPSFGL